MKRPITEIDITLTYTMWDGFPKTVKLIPKGVNPLKQARDFEAANPGAKAISLETVGTDERTRTYNMETIL